MPKAGAVGGATPTIPTGTPTGPQDGGTKTAVSPSDAKGAEAKPSAPPLAETSGRAPPETAPKAAVALAATQSAVALAATLAGLRAGQELRGTVRLLPGQPQALLTTPEGDFLIQPATGLEPDSPVSLVLIRADRIISALLLTTGRGALDVPRPVQLTLVSIHGAPAPAVEAEAAPGIPVASAPLRPVGTQVPAAPAPGLTSLLPGETISLRGGAQPPLPGTITPQAPAPLPARVPAPATPAPAGTGPAQSLSPNAPRPMLHGLVMPDAPDPATPLPAAAMRALPVGGADPLAALFDRGVMPLALHIGADTSTGPVRMLAASLLATAAPGETSPLTHPPAQSPLARLAETGRLVTATFLPSQGKAAAPSAAPPVPLPNAAAVQDGRPQAWPQPTPSPGTPAPAAMETGAATVAQPTTARPVLTQAPVSQSTTGTVATPAVSVSPSTAPASALQPPQSQPVQLSVNGTAARIELPAGVPTPAPSTQLVFLVTTGHEALRTLPAAEPKTIQPQQHFQPPQTQMPTPAPTQSAGVATSTVPAAQPATPHQPVVRGGLISSTGQNAHANPTTPTPNVRTDHAQGAAARGAGTVQTPATPAAPLPSAPNDMAALQEQPGLAWMPGMLLPASVMPAAPATVSGGEALLMAVMQALGRKGFTATPRTLSNHGADTDGADGVSGMPALARLLQTAAATATGAATTAAATARAEQAQDASLPANSPDALPFALTLQTPQGQIPLVFLVWQPVHADEDGRNDGVAGEGEADVCFAVEVDFESIGRLRLRGVMGQTHLDLGVETERSLGAALQHGANRDFTQAIEAGGMTGTLVFRHREGG